MLMYRDVEGWSIHRSTSRTPERLSNYDAAQLKEAWARERELTSEAPTYHTETRDHPFLDMSRGQAAMVQDANIMSGYVATDDYPPVALSLPSDKASVQLLDAQDISIDEMRHHPLGKISAVLSGAAGARRQQAPYYDPDTEYTQVEVIGKSVPSGGSRHPTETFLRVHRHDGLPSGFYYFHPLRHALIPVGADLGVLGEPEPTSSLDIEVFLASYVQRAMFRYRDPRSFRALLVDAGHLDAMVGALAAFVNWHYESSVHIDLDWASCVGIPMDSVGRELPLLASGRISGW